MIPALLIRRCRRGFLAANSPAKSRTLARLARSSAITSSAPAPAGSAVRSRAATCSPAGTLRQAITTCAPAPASTRAVSSPRPAPAPVTRATLSRREMFRSACSAVVRDPKPFRGRVTIWLRNIAGAREQRHFVCTLACRRVSRVRLRRKNAPGRIWSCPPCTGEVGDRAGRDIHGERRGNMAMIRGRSGEPSGLEKIRVVLALAAFLAPSAAGAQSHPLDPLTAAEIESTVQVLRGAGHLVEGSRLPILRLEEPAKSFVLDWKPGGSLTRRSLAVIKQGVRTFEAVVDITGRKVVSFREVPGVQPPILGEEFGLAQTIALADPRFQASLMARGISSFETILCAPLSAGHFAIPAERGKRLLRVATMSKAKRAGKIFVDYFRNDYTATAIADYAVRARPGAPVALPLDWKELKTLKSASQFTMRDVLKRLGRKNPPARSKEKGQRIPSGMSIARASLCLRRPDIKVKRVPTVLRLPRMDSACHHDS